MAPTRKRKSSVHIPNEIWDQIISKLGHERHLEPLSLVSRLFLSITNRHKQTLNLLNSTSYDPLFRRFPNLKHISFSEFPHDPLPILQEFADLNHHLETLNLSGRKCNFPFEELRKLQYSSILMALKAFKMRFSIVGDDILKMIVEFFPNLEELDLSYSYHESCDLTLNGVSMLVSNLKCLRKINLSGCYGLFDEHMILLSKNCVNLEEIVVKKCINVSESGISYVLQECKKLKAIRLGGDVGITYGNLHCTHWTRTLSEIDFSLMGVSNDLLTCMGEANFPLKKVTLSHCEGFTYDGLRKFLKTYNGLDHLSLVAVKFLGDSSIRALAKCLKQLSYVSFNRCFQLSDSTLFTLMKECPLLDTLKMEGTNLAGLAVNVDYAFSHKIIKTLNLSNNKMSDDLLEKIVAVCPNLESLDLSFCGSLSCKGVGIIMRECRFLRHLYILGCSGVKNLSLDIKTHKLELLGAVRSGIDDESLKCLAEKCSNLRSLDLSYCTSCTPRGILQVADKFTKLKKITLFGMDAESLNWMVETRPSMKKIIDVRLFSSNYLL